MRCDYSRNVWEKEIAFYLDATSFVYKRHPMDQARAPRGRIWRKISEGLDPGCTAKGRKEGCGGKIAHIMAAISNGQPVLIAEPFVKMNGQYFESFIDNDFDSVFQQANNTDGRYRLWVKKTKIHHRIVLEQKELMSRANAVLLSIQYSTKTWQVAVRPLSIRGTLKNKCCETSWARQNVSLFVLFSLYVMSPSYPHNFCHSFV